MDDPQLIDYYNTFPHGISVIDKMNEELEDLQMKYEQLEKEFNEYRKNHTIITYPMPKIKIDDFDQFKECGNRIYHSVPIFKKIIYDFLNHEGWILEYDSPHRGGTGVLGYADCGFWDTWETNDLKWGNTTAQAFYLDNEYCNTEYNIYLKCKLLDEFYQLFPEYTTRGYGWFHQQINECFGEVHSTLYIITAMNGRRGNKREYHDIIYKIIMEKLFGWGSVDEDYDEEVFPFEYDNGDYIQNIIYYQCNECKKRCAGEDIMGNMGEPNWWYLENGKYCEEPCRCKDY